jgi:hypothetical protein
MNSYLTTFHHKYSVWHDRLLSKGDRLVMVKYVLATTPIHVMLSTDIPKYIHDDINKCQRSFFWMSRCDGGGDNCSTA